MFSLNNLSMLMGMMSLRLRLLLICVYSVGSVSSYVNGRVMASMKIHGLMKVIWAMLSRFYMIF